ncbi:MAG: VWA domain-containing protein [Gammaproteobacteria bacterium]|nr:VWA domain-containing protein [Gammaproteobacteria bacterium]
MKYPAILQLFIILLTSLIGTTAYAATTAQAEQGIDIVFIVDSSGSMKQNDAQRLRVEAGKMFLNLLDARDRAAIISFSDKALQITPLLNLKTNDNERQLLQGMDAVSERGAFTNIYDALDQGYALLNKARSKGRKQHIVLMSDGKMDVGHHETDLRLTEKTLDVIGPKFAKARIKVHTITFTRSSNLPLMKLVAEDTRGTFNILNSTAEIHDVFSRIFEHSKSPDMLPVNEDSFIIDNNIREFTVLISKYKPNSLVALENPDGDLIDSNTKHRDVRWYNAKKFSLITVRNPVSGYWLIKYSEGGNKAYIITDLKLNVENAAEIAMGDSDVIRAWLEKDGKLIRRNALANTFKFKLKMTAPSGKVSEYALVDDGIDGDDLANDGYYQRSVDYTETGEYKLDILVNSETFDRKKTLFVTVKNSSTGQNPFSVKDASEPAVAVAESATHEAPAAEQHTPPAAPVVDPHKNVPPTEHVQPAEPAHESAAAATEHTAPEATTELPAKDEHAKSDVTDSVLIFVLINVIIGAIAGAYVIIKRLRKKSSASVTTTDTKDEIDLENSNTTTEEGDNAQPEPEIKDKPDNNQ